MLSAKIKKILESRESTSIELLREDDSLMLRGLSHKMADSPLIKKQAG